MPYDNNIQPYIRQNAHAIRDRPRILPVLPAAIVGFGGRKIQFYPFTTDRSNDGDIRVDGSRRRMRTKTKAVRRTEFE